MKISGRMKLQSTPQSVAIAFISFFLICCFFEGCKSTQTLGPTESYLASPRKPQTSVINVFADFEVSAIEDLLNEHLDSIIYNDDSFDNNNKDNLKLKAVKDGPIRLRYEQDQLFWELPVKVNMQKGMSLFGLNIPMVNSWQYSGEIKLRFKTSLSISRTWEAKTQTTSDGYSWVKKPQVKIGSVDVPVTMIANLLLPSNLAALSSTIDQTISENFDLRSLAEKGWKLLYNPVKLPGQYNAWLTATPYAISMVPIQGGGGHIRLGAAITSDVECLLDNTPPYGKENALPNLQTLKTPSDTFKINLLTDVPYSSINAMVLNQLGDSTFQYGTRKIKIESFRIFGTNGKLAVETSVSGNLRGKLYLTGTPYFNPADTTIRIKDLKFDFKTSSMIMKSAKWLFNARFERMITNSIAIPLRSNVAEVENQISKYFNHYPLAYRFELNGRISRLTVSDIYLTPESVKTNVVFLGKLSIGVAQKLGQTK